MPDIMMCDAANCPRSKQCYRHKDSGTKPDQYRQSFWLRDDTSPVGDACGNFWRTTALARALHDGSLP